MNGFGDHGPVKGLGRILFPVDFSAECGMAAPHVRALAGHFEAAVTVLHALPVPRYEFGMGMLGDLFPNRVQAAEKELRDFGNSHLAGIEWTARVAPGEAAGLIVDCARHEGSDLILMPTHGMGTFRRYLLGSTTAKVLHDAECPVFTGVHMDEPREHSPGIFQRILCAVDLKPHSARVLAWAACMARAQGAQLSVVHVVETLPVTAVRAPRDNWDRELLRNATAELNVLTMRVAPDAHNRVVTGAVSSSVGEVIREFNADLLVIGRAATGGLFGRLRSNAYDLVRESPCSVVSV